MESHIERLLGDISASKISIRSFSTSQADELTNKTTYAASKEHEPRHRED